MDTFQLKLPLLSRMVDRMLRSARLNRHNARELQPGVAMTPLVTGRSGNVKLALLEYQPGARVPLHRHRAPEILLVLSGSQSDDAGTVVAGTLVVNKRGSVHAVKSAEGCRLLIFWTRPVEFVAT